MCKLNVSLTHLSLNMICSDVSYLDATTPVPGHPVSVGSRSTSVGTAGNEMFPLLRNREPLITLDYVSIGFFSKEKKKNV